MTTELPLSPEEKDLLTTLAKTADREKRLAALSSVIAAVGLTSFKIVVGAATGSLGILAEAAHSALDLVAAIVTLFAIRISGKPADKEHLYGHWKVENLSALFETFLLLITCGWIIYEAIQRLLSKNIKIEVTIWAFIVMLVSIIIDFTRSRVLYRAARKHHSQALEADALHFSTDIWSSSVVIGGLFLVKLSDWIPSLNFLRQADAIAAIVVAGIVIYVSIQMGIRTIRGLMDTAPQGMVDQIKTIVESVPGVINCHNLRVRYSGPQIFVDAHILVSPNQSIVEVHDLTKQIEARIREIIAGADITVHPEPKED
jgi:cation diffusion facilitator family transporter